VPNAEATKEMVAKILSQLRQEKGQISQERLAALAEVDRTYVGKVERQITNPTIGKLNLLLDALGVSWQEFGVALDREKRAANENHGAPHIRRPRGRREP
jgi:transcriptional regulator with XRE-family HTH domain